MFESCSSRTWNGWKLLVHCFFKVFKHVILLAFSSQVAKDTQDWTRNEFKMRFWRNEVDFLARWKLSEKNAGRISWIRLDTFNLKPRRKVFFYCRSTGRTVALYTNSLITFWVEIVSQNFQLRLPEVGFAEFLCYSWRLKAITLLRRGMTLARGWKLNHAKRKGSLKTSGTLFIPQHFSRDRRHSSKMFTFVSFQRNQSFDRWCFP